MLPEETLQQIADELSHLTGERWVAVHVEEDDREIDRWEIRAEDGRAIRHRTVWNQADRVSWHGAYGRTKRGTRAYFREDVADSITTSVTRAPKAIATDLARRLLPGYTIRFGEAQRQIASEDLRQDRLADEIA